ncbi:D-alanyl-D-alanine carboxypeptidase family protein [Alkalihalobacillus sp. 1P02AB]|uniref:M15 family metallopeptidase n=1 Tax=Alkalihalobacillus sp. 1P02AB TaxID=3132260 RepID=UPI0039A69E8A
MLKKTVQIFMLFLLMTVVIGCSFLNNEQADDRLQEEAKQEEQEREKDVNYEGTSEEISASSNEDESEEVDGYLISADKINEVITVDGQAVIQNPDNIFANINREFLLPSDYKPDDLVAPNVRFSFEENLEKRYLREEAAFALEELFMAAEEADIELFAISGYRSYERQEVLYENALANHGADQEVVAMPGQSEHQTGLAMDVSSRSNGFALSAAFEETDEGQWLAAHAHEYGFIIRYPKGKEEITGYDFEPWHLRYIGTEIAEILFENDWTLEEYLGEVTPI